MSSQLLPTRRTISARPSFTYEELLERSRRELAVVSVTLSLFQRGDDRIYDHRPTHVRNLFKRGEPMMICLTALAAEPPA